MKKTPVFQFLPLKWWDFLIYAAFIGLFIYACLGIDFDQQAVSTKARTRLLYTSIGSQMIVLHGLHRWIRNACHFLFLLLIGSASLWLFFAVKDFQFESLDRGNVVSLALWLPFLFVLQSFRILKLNLSGEELSLPIGRSRYSWYGEVRPIDVVCVFAGYFMTIGLVCWINLA